jgi:hypothetical protein
LKRTLSRIGLGAVLCAAALGAACGPQSLSSSTEPLPAPSVSVPASSEPATSAPSPAIVSSPTAVPAPSSSTTLRYSSTPKVTVSPTSGTSGTSGACGGDYYRNVDGVCVHRPTAAPAAPAGASAVCADGTYSFSQHRQGTCSHHGGVASWL